MIASVTTWVTGYLFWWLCGFLVLGIVLQVIDMFTVKYEDSPWVPSYRKWYNRSRPVDQQLPPGTMGWFYNQPLRRRHNRAMLVSGAQSLGAVAFGSNALLEFVAFLAETWVTLPGLWLGLFAFNYLWKQDEYIERADQIRTRMMGMSWQALVAKVSALFARRTIASMTPMNAPTSPSAPATSQPAPAQPATPVARPKDGGMSAADIIARHKDGRAI